MLGCSGLAAIAVVVVLSGCTGSDANPPDDVGSAGGGGISPVAGASGSAGVNGSAAAGDSAAAGGGAGSGGGMAAGGSGMAGNGGSGGMAGNGGSGGSSGAAGGGGADAATQSAGCGRPRTLTDGRINLSSGGMERSYILRAPAEYDVSHPHRLVIAYHWLGGTADMVAGGGTTGGPYYGLWDLAEGSTIFVAPEGIDEGWGNADGQDVALTDAILAQVESELCIDTARVFAIGFSFGGAMSYAMACARPDVVRAVAILSGALLSGCDGGTEPVAYLAVRGVQEAVIDPVTTGRALRDHFAEVNGCTPQTPPEPATGSGTHICTTYDGCMAGFPVRWCAHDGGHTAAPTDQGQAMTWVPQEAWTFLEQF